jgi:hypothetical protein
MPTSNWAKIVIAAAAGVGLLIVWATTGALDFVFAKAIVTASSGVILGLLAFDRWLWRIRPFRWLHSRPVLHGTWKVELHTSHEPRAAETIEAYLIVRQTYSGISVDGIFDRSHSRCLSANLATVDGRCTLNYLFRTEAETLHREGNPPARGAASLRVAREPRLHLEGDYWMERLTRGKVVSVGWSPKFYDTFLGARGGEYG